MDQLTSSSRTSDKKNIKTSLELVVSTHSQKYARQVGSLLQGLGWNGEINKNYSSCHRYQSHPVSWVSKGLCATLSTFVFFAFAARAAFFRFSSEFEVDEEPVERNLQLAFRDIWSNISWLFAIIIQLAFLKNANPIITTFCFEISFGRKQTQPFLGS